MSAGRAKKNIKSMSRFAVTDPYLMADAEAGIGIWLPAVALVVRKAEEGAEGHARSLLIAVRLTHTGTKQIASVDQPLTRVRARTPGEAEVVRHLAELQ